jgi:hypothetical protein
MDRFANRLAALAAAPCFALALSATAAETAPQIFKCTDASGAVTYQNEPCPKSAKAGRVEIFDNRWSATNEEREAEWRRSASQHQLVAGMPGRWVREALGEPTEVRDTPTAGAAQLWLYKLPGRSIDVGMLNDQLLWFKETPVPTPSGRVASAPERPSAQPSSSAAQASQAPEHASSDLPVTRLAPPPPERTRNETARAASPSVNLARSAMERPRMTAEAAAAPNAPTDARPGAGRPVARGQDCRQALASLGAPTHQRDVPALDAGSDPATEYFYEPSPDGGRLRIVCVNGKVEGVDRSVAR